MIGIDEVGRGCWAGPLLVVAARATGQLPKGLKDSKSMTKLQRQKILNKLSISCSFGEGWVSANEIDSIGLADAMRLGAERALIDVGAKSREEIILDGSVNYVPQHFRVSKCVIDADALIPLVSAAGIYAKVRRDNHMSKLKKFYPEYGFESHVGYGTTKHRLAILKHGIIENIHRMSFKPIQNLNKARM